MSSVRMCDDCNAIFSENEDGWATFPGAINKRDSDGKMKPIVIQLDYCAACTAQKTGVREPQVPAVKGRYDSRYTRQLEKEVGIDPNA